ncbi:transporter substrate-binding domain-containing protein [Pelomonas sp. SE-A7]|uniref:substrate-binding periplasmic protein n=1 Tax=Pelomonas sp. SE-A7 TaxID=3054953 RepID=UPI00259C6814|nr:transporter substrate-binding domain-containing protein [Pelomonas sp. SE-A7]MDM4765767.1 transporter substrate-binding domain-containing protein [Pelomonas sp. SE-A7]
MLRLLTIAAALGLLTALAPARAAPACELPLRMAVEKRPPYVYKAPDGSLKGSDIELVQRILEQAGCKLELRPELPRKRRYAMFVAGEIDLLPSASINEERRQVAWFTAPYYREAVALFALPAKADSLRGITGFEDLLQRKISLVSQGFGWFGQGFETNKKALTEAGLLSHYDELDSALRMLKAGRGDLVMADRAAMRLLLRQQKIELVELPFLPVHDAAHLMLSKRSVGEAQFRAIDEALRRLEENGTLKAIRSRHGLQ